MFGLFDPFSVPTPPSFTHSPNPRVLYFVEGNSLDDKQLAGNTTSDLSKGTSLKEKRLNCIASGYPSVQ